MSTNAPANQSEREERMWAMFCHLSALALYIFPFFGNIIGPLIIWLIKKDQYPLVNDQGKESLNFQISLTIYAFVAFILAFVLIGLPVLLAIPIFQVVMIIIAAIQANEGKAYRYPLTIRFIT